MSRFSGPQPAGAGRKHRDNKRMEAEERNARTPIERTRQHREGDPGTRRGAWAMKKADKLSQRTPEERLLDAIFGR